jgi:hypothetical protein
MALAFVACLANAGPGQESRPESSPSGAVSVEALRREFQELRTALENEIDRVQADSRPDRDAAVEKLVAQFGKSAARIATSSLAIAEAAPKEPTALAAVYLALDTGLQDKQLAAALKVLAEHVRGDAICDVLPKLNGYGAKAIDSLLEDVLEKSQSRRARALACFQLAMRTRPEAARERLLERVIAEFSDVNFGKDDLGVVAERRLFAMRNLRIGKKAPDIEGKDMDGVAFKLSDYRGKVVVLDFWGFW